MNREPWREAAAIFDVAAVATAISLISQTYQVQGTFADFMRTWLLLSIPIVYLLRTTLGAIAYVIGWLCGCLRVGDSSRLQGIRCSSGFC